MTLNKQIITQRKEIEIKIIKINVGEKVMGVFLHISRSFDTGPPEILFETISLINIRKKELN